MEGSALGRGHVFGAILLVAGSCIGAGMLALPMVTGLVGFFPAVGIFLLCWAFMTVTGLLLLEVNLWLGEGVSLISMAERTLGGFGRMASWVLFCFLFYLVLIAYVVGSGALVSGVIGGGLGVVVPRSVGSLLFALFFGAVVYLGTRAVDLVNRALMVGLVVAYAALIVFGAPFVEGGLLRHVDLRFALMPLPVVVIAFGYHNMIPSLTRYLRQNIKAMRLTVVIGSLLPLLIYLVWEWLILGIVPVGGPDGLAEGLQRGDLATASLGELAGGRAVAYAADAFSFFAIVTSFLGQGLSLVHFLADGLKVELTRLKSLYLTLLVIVPPLVAALWDPRIFIRALGVAGGFSAVILFGILPALMVWIGRYRRREVTCRLVAGGRVTLIAVIAFSLLVMATELMNQLGVWR